MHVTPQLTLDVHPHPELDGEPGLLAGALKVTGEYMLNRDLNIGDELVVVIQSADGEVLTSAKAKVGPVTLGPIEDKDLGVIGTERAHRAKVTD